MAQNGALFISRWRVQSRQELLVVVEFELGYGLHDHVHHPGLVGTQMGNQLVRIDQLVRRLDCPCHPEDVVVFLGRLLGRLWPLIRW